MSDTMSAVVWTQYGPPDVLELRQIERPSPGRREVLIRIHAATVFPGDCELRRLDLPWFLRIPVRLLAGLWKPRGNRVLGQELAGEVVALGPDAQRFKVGDRVFAGTGIGRFGAHAEYICLAEDGPVEIMPRGSTFEEAAALPVAGFNALHFLKKACLGRGEQVLINGAGGTIGTLAIQIAKSFEAEVTVVDDPRKLPALLELGASRGIDYTREDFTTARRRYDVILDIVGTANYSACLRALRPNGRLLLLDTTPSNLVRSRMTSVMSDKSVVCEIPEMTTEHLSELRNFFESGTVLPIIDRVYPLNESVDAHRYVEAGTKIGHVVLRVGK